MADVLRFSGWWRHHDRQCKPGRFEFEEPHNFFGAKNVELYVTFITETYPIPEEAFDGTR